MRSQNTKALPTGAVSRNTTPAPDAPLTLEILQGGFSIGTMSLTRLECRRLRLFAEVNKQPVAEFIAFAVRYTIAVDENEFDYTIHKEVCHAADRRQQRRLARIRKGGAK